MTPTEALAAFIAFSALVRTLVEIVKNTVDPNGTMASAIWNYVALVIGVALALIAQLNAVPEELGGSRLTGVAGQIITGLLLSGGAGVLHDIVTRPTQTVVENPSTVEVKTKAK